MRPDARSSRWEPVDGDAPMPFVGPMDTELESLAAELEAAGAQARRMLYGRTQPTRFFATRLRERLLGRYGADASNPAQPGGRRDRRP